MKDEVERDFRIAVIGRAGRFPAARSVDAFWRMLAEGRSGLSRPSDAELLAEGVSRAALADPDYVRAAHILPDMECFDAGFFGFSPRDAAILDPQHRHFLECGWEVLEDAGHLPETFEGRIGVYAGSGMQAYLPYNLLTNRELVEEIGLFLLRHTGNDKDFLPTRLSYLLNLTGPSVAVQTACSTSLVAVHMAATALNNFECDLAIAGGVTIELPHRVGYRFQAGEILSPDGLCRAFDDASQGTVFGSGVALVALRRLEDAVADGDDIKAVILGSAINNDGSVKASYLAPSVGGQAEAASEALGLAGVEPGTVSYIEAHGTGTPIGDPIELEALRLAYGAAAPGSIGIGSVKTNIGHLDTAAGAAGLIKVVEALRHRRLPATLNFSKPNGRFDFASSPFQVVAEGRDWASAGPRRAAVNSLGVGGTNAHVLVEEAPTVPRAAEDGRWRLFPLSARSDGALDGTAAKWLDWLGRGEGVPASQDIAHTLRTGRRGFAKRIAVAARGPGELAEALAGRAPGLIRRGEAGAAAPEVVFLFPGGGAQYPGAGTELMAASPAFREAVESCFAALPEMAPADLRAMMFDRLLEDEEARGKLDRCAYAIPALFILSYGYAKLWEGWGVVPSTVLAHSAGEFAAAVVSGVLSLRDALRMVTLRGAVMDDAPKGAMVTVPAPEGEVRALIGERLDIAALNAPGACVVSGGVAEIEALERRLAGTDLEARRIRIDVAAHSRLLDGQLERFRAGIGDVAFRAPKVPMVSSLRGGWAQGDDFGSADYWVRQLRGTVRFGDALKAVLDRPGRIVVECGPGQTLAPLVGLAEGAQGPVSVLPSAPKPTDPTDEMGFALAAAGGLWAAGVPLDWTRLDGNSGRRVSVPTYAFEKQRHWIAPGKGAVAGAEERAPELQRIASMDRWFEALGWAPAPQGGERRTFGGRWLVFAGEDAVSEAVLAELRQAGADVTVVRAGETFAAVADGFALRPDAAEDYEALADVLGEMPARVLHLWALSAESARAAFAGGYLTARMLQMAEASGETRLVVAVSGAASVAGEAVTGVDGAVMLGPVRVAPREVTGLTAALVDIDPEGAPDQSARQVLGEFALPDAADHVAWRRGVRHARVQIAMPVSRPEGLPSRLRQGGVYVVTGGSGGIGRELALWLAERAKARVALLSRRGEVDEALPAAVAERRGEVAALAADVTSRQALAAALDEVRARWGRIDGVIHAAGLLYDAPLSAKSLEEAEAVMAPKVEGGRNLMALLPEGSVDFLALVSSTSVVLGGAGQADYVAANAWLEAAALGRRDAFSVAWGLWSDTGMAARAFGTVGGEAGRWTRSDQAGGGVRYDVVVDPATDWVVREHVVGGVPVMPGAGFLDMAARAARDLLDGRAVALQDLSIAAPMTFGEGLPRRVSLELTPERQGYDLRIRSALGAGHGEVEHARLFLDALGETALPATTGDGRTLQPAPAVLWQESSINFGPRWRALRTLRQGEGVVEGEIELADAFRSDLDDHPLHPALLDVAATLGLALLDQGAEAGSLFAPMSAERVRIFGPLPGRLSTRVELVSYQPRSFATFDVVLTSPEGEVVVAIEKLAMRALDADALTAKGPAPTLTHQLLATGIRAREASELYDRIFDQRAPQIVVSPVSLDLVRLAMVEAAPAARRAERATVPTALIASPVAAKLAGLWQELLGVASVRESDDFFALGGHSLQAVRLFSRIRKEWDLRLPLTTLFEAPTLGALADRIAAKAGVATSASTESTGPAVGEAWSPLVVINKGSPQVRPLFCIHGAGGNILNFRPLAGFLDPSLPFVGVRAWVSEDGSEVDTTIEAMADRYLRAVLEFQAVGPYRLAGFSGGGVIAFEVAQRLRQAGQVVEQLFLLDTLAPDFAQRPIGLVQKLWAVRQWDLDFALQWYARRRKARQDAEVSAALQRQLLEDGKVPDEAIGVRMEAAYLDAQRSYVPHPFDGPVTIFRALRGGTQFLAAGPRLGWDAYLTGPVEVVAVQSDHFSLMAVPAVTQVGGVLSRKLLVAAKDEDR